MDDRGSWFVRLNVRGKEGKETVHTYTYILHMNKHSRPCQIWPVHDLCLNQFRYSLPYA